ncbi:hypothetical protein [Brachybacterium alimentarium]|uniref:hypothetical protein n=3 Tax=Brachybacterium alimentarium TaxID=47845 RepID=UPI000BB8220B|nr:hypothetical protein [Brachybacterium alimentarium]PCC33746.1 hypothetical protein CIK71_08695 [Brachybacterium alimentarium]RCS64144.1 hypothetical protein CIK73_15110 [Brachybacterium alimentarium]RCS75048.1 hypothetical protein CIK68_04790 [Brachybacterium alimentarium]RCS80223.1 hypothetical protein CIK72_07610 [Brachybacterium alimentarium]RCS82303.1 hypothetical protein CIK70_01915 [Brachybacterium alimentarium]
MKDVAGWLTAGALVVGSLAVGLAPVVAVMGVAILMDVALRTGHVVALLASFGIAIVWLLFVSFTEIPLKIALRKSSPVAREIIINLFALTLLAFSYFVIVEQFLASAIMAALSFAGYLALRPLIERAERAADALPRDTQ